MKFSIRLISIFVFANVVAGFLPVSTPTSSTISVQSSASAAPTDEATDGKNEMTTNGPSAGAKRDENMTGKMQTMLREAQISITDAIEKIDGKGKFQEDEWVRPTGGGGVSRVLSGGNVWEKAGIGLSVIHGEMPQENLRAAKDRGTARSSKDEKVPFCAAGLSCVMHPRNPHCPTMHFNYRYFETDDGEHWWFGGGTDITPSYVDEEDMQHFHGVYKDVCDRHDPEFYPMMKKAADDYFLIPHRGERRGLGGIFYDDLNDREPEKLFKFAKDAVNHVVPAYGPIIEKHKNDDFTEEQKQWQQLRRGRYVEFNLVNDRGTIFGLKTGIGRTESILMTLPETASWLYDHQPAPGSPEANFLDAARNPRDWV